MEILIPLLKRFPLIIIHELDHIKEYAFEKCKRNYIGSHQHWNLGPKIVKYQYIKQKKFSNIHDITAKYFDVNIKNHIKGLKFFTTRDKYLIPKLQVSSISSCLPTI